MRGDMGVGQHFDNKNQILTLRKIWPRIQSRADPVQMGLATRAKRGRKGDAGDRVIWFRCSRACRLQR